MTEQDEGRRGRRAAVVLFDQLVSLKLPYPVGVVLHFLECEAKERKKESVETQDGDLEAAGRLRLTKR